MAATFYALSSRTLPLGDTVTLLNLTPIFLAVLAPIFLREPTGRAVALALLLRAAPRVGRRDADPPPEHADRRS